MVGAGSKDISKPSSRQTKKDKRQAGEKKHEAILAMLEEYDAILDKNYRLPRPRYRGRVRHIPSPAAKASSLADEKKILERVQEKIAEQYSQSATVSDDRFAIIIAQIDSIQARSERAERELADCLKREQLLHKEIEMLRRDNDKTAKRFQQKQDQLKAFCFEKVGMLSVDIKSQDEQMHQLHQQSLNAQRKDVKSQNKKFKELSQDIVDIKHNQERVEAVYKQATINSIKKSELEDMRCEQKFFEEKIQRKMQQSEEYFVTESVITGMKKVIGDFKEEITKRQDDLETYSAAELDKMFKNEELIRKQHEQLVEILELEGVQGRLEPHSVFKYNADEEHADDSAYQGEPVVPQNNSASMAPRNEVPKTFEDVKDMAQMLSTQMMNKAKEKPIIELGDADLAKLGKLPEPKYKKLEEDLSYEDPTFEEALAQSFSSQALYEQLQALQKRTT